MAGQARVIARRMPKLGETGIVIVINPAGRSLLEFKLGQVATEV
jgi:hypothetical protein